MYLKVFNPFELFVFKSLRLLRLKKMFYSAYVPTRSELKCLIKYNNIHKGKRCFILGGGPSLLKIDPSKLREEYTFGVNGIFLIRDWLGFEPSYYVVEDFLVYQDRWKDILKNIQESTCFFPIQFSNDSFDRPNHNYFRAIYEFDENVGFPRFTDNFAKLVWIGGTVTYVCIQLAFYMGFKEVYLVGMDHSYKKPEHVRVNGNEWTSNGDDPNHFHKDYFGKGYRWHDPMVWRMELAYNKARQVFEENNRIIQNATIGGSLEIFERVCFDELF